MTTPRSTRLKRPNFTILAVQFAAILVGCALLALGILGFVPGVTTRLDTLDWTGHQSGAALFGIFQISMLHNLFHIAIGVAGLILARTYARARAYLLGGGVLLLGVWIYGLLAGPGKASDVVPMNTPDTWLHFGFGVAMVILGLTLAGARVPTGAGGEVLPTEAD